MAQKTFGEISKRIVALTSEIAKLELEYKKLKATGESTEKIQKKLAKDYELLTKKLTTLTNVTKQYNNQSNTNIRQAKLINERLAVTTKRYDDLSRAINKTSTSQKSAGQAFLATFSQATLGRIAAYIGIYQLLYAAVNAVKNITIGSVQAFINFQDSIGKLRAVLGANKDETNELSDSIRKTAVETRFTATQVTDLATSLAKLGATSEEIPQLILPVALAAQALGESLDAVGETVFKVKNQFGLSAAETATTAQTLVSAINESALSLGTFNTAIQYIGPIAAQTGLAFSETAGYLQVLADNGFSASRIGTGLRGIFIDIKEAGVPLIETLQKLADENISVARATDLVGKRAAAQLITLVDNIEVLKEASDESRQFTNSLKASAAQMSTAAGQLDILKSAYEELRISIGASIVSSEAFLDLIGLLSIKSEQLARGYVELDNILSDQEGSEVLRSNIESLLDGTVDSIGAFDAALNTLKELGKSQELLAIFTKLESAGLRTSEAQALLSYRLNQGKAATQRYIKNYELTTEQLKIVNTALNDTNDLIENQFNGLRGLQGIVLQEAQAIQSSNQVRNERNRIEESYAGELEKVKSLGAGSNAAIEESRVLQKQLNDEIKITSEELEKERAGSVSTNKELVNQLEGRLSGLQNVRKELSELGYVSDDDEKSRLDARKKQLKLDKDGIELRRAQIKEEIRQIKKIRDERIKAIEAERDLQLKSAATSTERTQIEMKAAKAIKDANAEVVDSLEQVSEKTQVLIEDTTELEIKYKTDFPEAFNEFALSFEKILFDIQEFGNEIVTTPQKAAEALLSQLDSVMAGFEQSMTEMKEFYGNSIQGQRDYAEASQREFDKLKDNLSDLVAEYYSTKAALEVALGPEVAAMVLKPLSDAIDAAEVKLNALGFKVKQGAEKIAKDTKESYRQLYIDGLEEALKTAIDALNKFNDVAFENTKDRIEREQDLVEARYEVESDILKSQLDNQLITEEEFRNKQQQLRKKQIGEENTLEKALFDASQKRDKQNATADYLQALASIIPNLILYDKTADPATLIPKSIITGALATAAYGAELSAIGQRKFVPKKFAEGGMVDGPAHSEGGVPFTVQGRSGYEMEGGEFIVNKRAARLHRQTLERINSSVKPQAQNGKLMFETGGVIPSVGITASQLSNQSGGAEATIAQLEYLRSIAETNLSISGNTSKPVRAYVSAADLGTNDAERKIKERNTRI